MSIGPLERIAPEGTMLGERYFSEAMSTSTSER